MTYITCPSLFLSWLAPAFQTPVRLHHVKEEREEIFVKARKSRLDLVAMADELSLRKMELLEDYEAEKA